MTVKRNVVEKSYVPWCDYCNFPARYEAERKAGQF